MPTDSELNDLVASLAAEVERATRAVFDRFGPGAEGFAGMLSYPLGWVDAELRPLDRPADAGKRLRPVLCLLICQAVGGVAGEALGAATAVELVHNFSLIHDDIQDESPTRRGRPTVWARWQTAQAINVGDSLFALAQLAILEGSGPADRRLLGASRLNLACLRLVEGQYLDLELQASGRATLEDYQNMISGKTAALLECAAWLGALFGSGDLERAERFGEFGRQLGLAFQLQDDVLGLWGDPAETGKSAETDLLTRKQALPAILALQASGPEADSFRELFLASRPLTEVDARQARLLLERLGVRERAEGMVSSGYVRAESTLRAALDGAEGAPLWALLARFRQRKG